jgi:hypothetical protein
MEFEHRGAGRRGEPTPSQAGRPDQKQTPQQRGEGIRGVPPPDEQAKLQQEGGERQPLPGVWDILERRVRLDARDVEDRPRGQEYDREHHKLSQMVKELMERGTARDNLIINLYGEIRCEPAPFPNPVRLRDLSLKEFQKFRSKIEPLSKEEIAEEIRKAEEEFDRKSDEFFKKEGGGLRGLPSPDSIIRV